MKKLLIGITCSEEQINGRDTNRLSSTYIEAITGCDAIPVIIPFQLNENQTEHLVELLDGIVLSGGVDVNPLLYGEEPKYKNGSSNYKRDIQEMNIIKYARRFNKPILGICRGSQIVNVYFKGTIYQDNTMHPSNYLQHQQKEERCYPSHKVKIRKDSFMYTIFGGEYLVNSLHHQSVNELAPEFTIAAEATDGIVEGFENKDRSIICVQFHPEMMYSTDGKMRKFFEEWCLLVEEKKYERVNK